jgi:hypothetical protein
LCPVPGISDVLSRDDSKCAIGIPESVCIRKRAVLEHDIGVESEHCFQFTAVVDIRRPILQAPDCPVGKFSGSCVRQYRCRRYNGRTTRQFAAVNIERIQVVAVNLKCCCFISKEAIEKRHPPLSFNCVPAMIVLHLQFRYRYVS